MHLRFISFLLILTLLNCSDNNNVVKYKSFKYGWFSDEKVKFKFKLKQIEENNLFIDLRNNNDYKFSRTSRNKENISGVALNKNFSDLCLCRV